MKCELCRQRLLPYLYDALDDPERAELAGHLETCSECQEALEAARRQLGLLAEAVKEPAAGVVFKAPAKLTPASAAETITLPRPARRGPWLLNRWSAAAAILLLFCAAGAVLGWSSYRESTARLEEARRRLAQARDNFGKDQDELNRKKAQTQQEIRAIQKQIDELFTDWKQQEAVKIKPVDDKRAELPQIIVNGPQAPLAGAVNSYEIEIRQDNANQKDMPAGKAYGTQKMPAANPLATNFEARVVDQNNKVLYQKKLQVQPNNRANFDLPPELPIKPGDDICLEFLAATADGKAVALRDNLKLAFPDYVTHLATDRPIYRPGDTVRFRSLTLERFSLKPAQQKFHLRYRIVGPAPQLAEVCNKEAASDLVGADKQPVLGPGGMPVFGVGVGEFSLPADLVDGEYTLSVGEVNDRFRTEKRNFLVRRTQVTRLNKDVQFHRSSYGPGELVKITVRAAPAQGMPPIPNNIQVDASVTIDGALQYEQSRQTDSDGHADFEFTLPAQIAQGVGIVTVKCSDGGNVETTVRNLPIVLRDLHVDFYPEGGDLIAGVPNRVYFQARTPANKPAFMRGTILSDKKQEIAHIQTVTDDKEPGVNQGLGSFTFTPALGKRYSLRIDSPIGIDRPITLPPAKDRGVVLHVPEGVVERDISVTLRNVREPRELLVGAYCRGRMLAAQPVQVKANESAQVTLKPISEIGGVYRITVFEKTAAAGQAVYRPIAERLIYRKNPARLDVAIECDRPRYQPGETVRLQLRSANEKGESVPALACVAVVDASVLKLRDEKTARTMPTHFLLTTEIRAPEELEHADFFLSDHPKAAESLDLLLGSQGWRRFAEQDPKRFQLAQQKPQPPVFLANSISVPQLLDAEQKQLDKLDEEFVPKAVDLQKKLAASETAEQQLQPIAAAPAADLAVQQAQRRIDEAAQEVREIRMFLVQFGLGGALLTLLFVGFFLVSVGLRRLSEGGNPRRWLIAGLSLLALLFLISVIGTFGLMGQPIGDDFGWDRWEAKKPAGVAFMPMNPPPPAVPAPVETSEKDEADAEETPMLPGVNPAKKIVRGGGVQPAVQLELQAALVQNPPMFMLNNANPPLAQVAVMDAGWDERVLRQQGNYQSIVQKHLGRRVQLPPVRELCVVREYAHKHHESPDGPRRDFADTLYWQPVLVLADGKAAVQFDLGDAVTRYHVLVFSHTHDGRLGANSAEIAARLPFTIEPKAPLEVAQSDQIAIPTACVNESDQKVSLQLSARAKGLALQDDGPRGLTLEPGQTKRSAWHASPAIAEGPASLRIVGKINGYADAAERKLTVVPDGFPVEIGQSGVLEITPIEHEINLPADWAPGTLKVQAHFYPTPTAELQGALEALEREPTGCCEQTVSSAYVATLILSQMAQARETNPVLEKRARQIAQAAHHRLLAFECRDPVQPGARGGFAWFGGGPPDLALSAYGFLACRDSARFLAVDDSIRKRTEKFLLAQRDGKGGFKIGSSPDGIAHAYTLWALTDGGVSEDLGLELESLRNACKSSKDPYLLSLAALAHFGSKKNLLGIELLQRLRSHQQEDGRFVAATTSITGSQGHDLAVETTALAILAFLKSERFEFDKELGGAYRWLSKQRRGPATFGGSQATVLALKAMLAYHQRQPRQLQGGDVQLLLRTNQPPGQPVGVNFNAPMMAIADPTIAKTSFAPRGPDPITLTFRGNMRPGKNVFQLSLTGNNILPYTLRWSYHTLKAPSNASAPIKLDVMLGSPRIKEGEAVKLSAKVENATDKRQGVAVAIVGLPAGLSLPDDTEPMETLVRKQKISAWEVRGRDLVLYWRELEPKAKIDVELDLVGRLPGVYKGPASRAYPVYDAERKFCIEPLAIRVLEAE